MSSYDVGKVHRIAILVAVLALLGLHLVLIEPIQGVQFSWRGQSAAFVGMAPGLFTAPLMAAWGAVCGSRLRATRAWRLTAVRSRIEIVGRAFFFPAVVVVVIQVVSGLLILARSVGPLPSAAIVGVALGPFALLIGGLGWGAVLGRAFPVVVAAPVAMFSLYLGLALPMTLEPMGIRHLVGIQLACCSIYSEPASSAVFAPILLWLIVAATSFASTVVDRWPIAGVVATLVAGMGLAGTVYPYVADLGPDPTAARSEAWLGCRGERPTICLWPESEPYRDNANQAASRVYQALTELDIAPPPVVTEQYPARWSMIATVSEEGTLLSAVVGLVSPPPPPCATAGETWPTGRYQLVLAAWLAGKVDVPASLISTSFGPEAFASAQQVSALPVGGQREWFDRNLAAMSQCNVGPFPPR